MLRNFSFGVFLLIGFHLTGQDLAGQLINAVNKGANLKEAGEIEAALHTLDSALLVAIDSGMVFHQANLTYHLGLTYMVDEDFERGEKNLRQAFELFKSMNGRQNRMAGSSLMNAGDVMREQGRMKEAQNFITEGIDFLSENLVKREDSIMLANLFNRRSDIYRLTGEYDKAKSTLYGAPFWPGVGYVFYYTNLANAFKDEGVYLDSAEYYYKLDLDLEINSEEPITRIIANRQGNLGSFYILQKEYNLAYPLLLSSLNNFRKVDHSDTLQALISLTEIELVRRNISKAKTYLERIDNGVNKFTDEEILEQYFRVKRDYAAFSNDKDGYEFYLDKSDSLSKKKFEEDRIRIINLDNELERSILENQAKAQEEELAKQRFIEIALGISLVIALAIVYYVNRTGKRLRTLSDRNELLVREQNHRVKNNLQMINSLLSLQAGRLKDEQSKDVLKRSQTRIQAISLLNRALYEQKNISRVKLNQYIEELAEDVINSITDQHVVHTIEVPEIDIDIDKATSLGLIINELIVNSIKHNTSESTGFYLGITEESQGWALKYSDNNKEFDLAAYEQSKSFGKKLIELQAKQLKANLEIKSSDHFELKLVFNS